MLDSICLLILYALFHTSPHSVELFTKGTQVIWAFDLESSSILHDTPLSLHNSNQFMVEFMFSFMSPITLPFIFLQFWFRQRAGCDGQYPSNVGMKVFSSIVSRISSESYSWIWVTCSVLSLKRSQYAFLMIHLRVYVEAGSPLHYYVLVGDHFYADHYPPSADIKKFITVCVVLDMVID